MKIVVIIPARMGFSRFPGKPLVPLLGRPMIEHVFHRAAMSATVGEVLVATCDEEIRQAAENLGAPDVMTAASHERASDRIAEAAKSCDADVIVLVQGDEPTIIPETIDAAVTAVIDDSEVSCVNLAKRILTEDEFLNSDTIKVVINSRGDALYFSRSPIPTTSVKPFNEILAFKQVCVIPFRREALIDYAKLPPTPLEIAESIDMMRFFGTGAKCPYGGNNSRILCGRQARGCPTSRVSPGQRSPCLALPNSRPPIQIDTTHFRFEPHRYPDFQSQKSSVTRTAVPVTI